MYPSHQWPPPRPVYDYPSPAPRANKIALIAAIVAAVIVGWVTLLGVVYSLSTSSQSSHAPSSAMVYTESEQYYVRMLHASGVNEPDSQLVAVGHQVCGDLGHSGYTPAVVGEIRMIMQTRGWSKTTASAVVARAVVDLCPPQ
jgi:hypothetical protein